MGVIQWFTDPANWTGENGIPVRTLQQIEISLWAMAIALVIALPIALTLGHLRKGMVLATNIGNVGRAVPTLGVLTILASIPEIGIGNLAAILALALFAIPPVLTNTYTGLASVDDEVRDAARGMGMGGMGILSKVEVPLAVPLIAAGIRTATVQVVATASLAALVGSGGLGPLRGGRVRAAGQHPDHRRRDPDGAVGHRRGVAALGGAALGHPEGFARADPRRGGDAGDPGGARPALRVAPGLPGCGWMGA